MLTTDDSLQTWSDFEYNVLRWANKKLNEPKQLTGVVDFMVSEDFLSILLKSLLEQITHRCGGRAATFTKFGKRLHELQ